MDELDSYARAAARLAGLEIDEAWWPGVRHHLAVLRDNAALVEAVDIAASAASFDPADTRRPREPTGSADAREPTESAEATR